MLIRSSLFSQGGFNGQPGLDDVLRYHTIEITRRIQAISKVEQLNDDFLKRIVKDSLVEPLVLSFEEMTYLQRTEDVPAEYFDSFEFNVTRGRSYPKTVVRISIPFKGDEKLLYLSPNTFGLTRPMGEVSGNRIQFDILLKGHSDDEARCKREIDQNKEQLISYVNASTLQINHFNQTVPKEITAVFQKKLDELTKQHAFLDGLGLKREVTPSLSNIADQTENKPSVRASKERSKEPKVIIQIIEKMYVEQLNQTTNRTCRTRLPGLFA